jgi:hypothetical protein
MLFATDGLNLDQVPVLEESRKDPEKDQTSVVDQDP